MILQPYLQNLMPQAQQINEPNTIKIVQSLYNKYRYKYKQPYASIAATQKSQQQQIIIKQQKQYQIYPSQIINQILEQSLSSTYIQYRDLCYLSQTQQCMKRQYPSWQQNKKIQTLSEYYKFHRNLPVWNDKSIGLIMQKYYNKIKDIDYKIIKQILKKQQGISLTTRKSFSSFQESFCPENSNCSNLLQHLQNSNDSIILRDFCEKADVALKKVEVQKYFKGTYYTGQNKFQQYLRKQQKRKATNNKLKRKQVVKENSGVNKGKPHKKQNSALNSERKNIQNKQKLQELLSPTHSYKQNCFMPPKPKKFLSKELYLETQKFSRELQKRGQRNNSLQKFPNYEQSTSCKKQLSKSKQKLQSTKSKNLLKNQLNIPNPKLVKTFNVPQITPKNKLNKKQLEIGQQSKQNLPNSLINKFSMKKLQSKTKLTQRSRSKSNGPFKPIEFLKQNNKKQFLNSIKTNPSSSRSKLRTNMPITVAKGSVIQLNQLTKQTKNQRKIQKSLTSRQSSYKTFRSSNSTTVKNLTKSINKSSNQTTDTYINNNNQLIKTHQKLHYTLNSNNSQKHLRNKTSINNLHTKQNQNIMININLPMLSPENIMSKNNNSKNLNNQKLFVKKSTSGVENIVQRKLIALKRKLIQN